MKVWNLGGFIDVEIGQKVLIARCGSGHNYFGEFGKLVRTTKNNLVFETESGAIVKTSIDTLNTVGKAAKEHYFVSIKVDGREEDKNFIHQSVRYWNEKKLCFEKK